MSFKFGNSSNKHLANVDPLLVLVTRRALELSKYDFGITCSLRTGEEQAAMVASGSSLTYDSRHLPNIDGKSEAVDIVIYKGGAITWDSKYYRKVAKAFFAAAIELNIQIEWGGHWENLVDGPHYQLQREQS